MPPYRASTRISISWSGAPATEDTDTLVITFPGQYYLDLRVFVEGERKGEVDWAAVGLVKEVPSSDPGKPSNTLQFIPILSSRPPLPADLPETPDEGSFTTLPNGDISETGEMYNPSTGTIEPYVEVWRRLKLSEGGGRAEGLLLESVGEGGIKVFIGKLGDRAIGISHDPSVTTVPHPGIVPGIATYLAHLTPTGWDKTYTSGATAQSAGMPLPPASATGEGWVEGEEVEWEGAQWVVRVCGWAL